MCTPERRSLHVIGHPQANMAITELSERLRAIPGVRSVELTR